MRIERGKLASLLFASIRAWSWRPADSAAIHAPAFEAIALSPDFIEDVDADPDPDDSAGEKQRSNPDGDPGHGEPS